MHYFEKALSPRVWLKSLGAGIVAVIIGVILGFGDGVNGALFWVFALITFFTIVLNPQQALFCPWCRKRVKIGATVCHHCGRSTVPGEGP